MALLLVMPGLWANPVKTDHVEAELIAEETALVPGRTLSVGLRLIMEDHWHTYWLNPGDSGLATTLEWSLPPGFEAGPLQWPRPQRLPVDVLMNYGYEGEVLLISELAVPDDLPVGGRVTLRARADWLVCKEICLPGGADLELTLPVAPESSADPVRRKLFETARSRLPEPAEGWSFRAERQEGSWLLRMEPPRPGADPPPADVYFFAADEGVVEPSAPQKLEPLENGAVLRLQVASFEESPAERLRGVLVAGGDWPGEESSALWVDAEVVGPTAGAVASSMREAADRGLPPTLWAILGAAFVGGLILNLMPCVFPVLSIKIFSFVRQAGEDRSAVARHGWAFTAGVMVSFWILAGILLAIRAGGEELGWGYQLQSPGFVIFLCFVLLAFALSLFGVFELGGSVAAAAGRWGAGAGLTGSFSNGVLATVLATPCTAPFMGPALAFSLTQPAGTSLLVFSFLAAGLAAPYLILSLNPRLLKVLPKPGAWMETFKQFMAFPVLATVVWLLWVLGLQIGISGMVRVLAGLLLAGIAFWALGKWGAPLRAAPVRLAGRLAAVLLIAAGASWAYSASDFAPGAAGESASDGGLVWVPYSAEELARLRSEGRPVFLDFTAAWCATCQVNEMVVFGSDEVRQKLAEKEVVLMKADWTRRDPAITAALAEFGRSAVPLYVLYGRNPSAGPVFVKELISPAGFLEALDLLP